MEHLLDSYNDTEMYIDCFVVTGTLVSDDDGL
jgi:hypothetical protein